MSAKPNYFRLGLFILAAVAATVAIVLTLGGGTLFRKTVTMETYFDDSVQGLDVGSKVKYRGVLIGEVTELGFTATRYEQELPPPQRKPYVYVEAKLYPQQAGIRGGSDPVTLATLVQQGLRVRMSAQGITGTYFLEFDYFDPDRTPVLPLNWTPENLYIPSGPSTAMQIASRAEAFLKNFDEMNLPQVARNFDVLITRLSGKVDQLDVDALGKETRALLIELRAATARIDKVLGSPAAHAAVNDAAAAAARLREVLANPGFDRLPDDANAAFAALRKLAESEDLRLALRHLEATLAGLERSFGGRDADIAITLDNLRQITDNLRDLSEYAKRYPSGAVLGAPPQPASPSRGER